MRRIAGGELDEVLRRHPFPEGRLRARRAEDDADVGTLGGLDPVERLDGAEARIEDHVAPRAASAERADVGLADPPEGHRLEPEHDAIEAERPAVRGLRFGDTFLRLLAHLERELHRSEAHRLVCGHARREGAETDARAEDGGAHQKPPSTPRLGTLTGPITRS